MNDDNVVDFTSKEYTISLKREDALNLVALLTQYECLASCWFKNNEPAVSTTAVLARNILEQAVRDGLLVTDQEFKDRVNSFLVTGLDIHA